MFKREDAFTLIELMIVISVIGILIGMIIPNGAKVQEKADETVVKYHLNLLDNFNQALKGEYGRYPNSVTGKDIPDVLKDYASVDDNYKYISNNLDDKNFNNDPTDDSFNSSTYIIYYDFKIGGQYYYVDSLDKRIKRSKEIPTLAY
ncbi:general secretion pathway protein G [Orenia metallireducens]|uniref:General secretion pathway protein G n=1 Tax=Orenia metallireducens TaxID=1413210 RepID=A0A285F2T5_9FIRM|nr:prepilin-type N-terminal cleavage/methylation domain-containing protein [Orenia metallireducens]PRX34776.1 general secretion pathway protein G [Orenia metallireducens]SNY05582.1 general secretion pathway protein G [Orenia metallireducens]